MKTWRWLDLHAVLGEPIDRSKRIPVTIRFGVTRPDGTIEKVAGLQPRLEEWDCSCLAAQVTETFQPTQDDTWVLLLVCSGHPTFGEGELRIPQPPSA